MLIWIFYLAGQLLHFLLKADAAVATPNKLNAVTSRVQWFVKNRIVLAVRFFASSLFFLIFARGGASLLGMHDLPSLAGVDPLVKAAVCGLIGLAADSILDALTARVSWLQNQIPAAPNGHDEDDKARAAGVGS